MTRRLYLFDDRVARGWAPFALTRPAGEILFGALLLRTRIERATGRTVSAYLAVPGITGYDEPGSPPARLPESVPTGDARIILLSRYVPPLPGEDGSGPALPLPDRIPPEGIRLLVEDAPVGWLLPPGHPAPTPDELLDPETDQAPTRPELPLPGTLLPDPWSLVEANADRIARDLPILGSGSTGTALRPLPELPAVHRIGPHPVTMEGGVSIDPQVVFDAREGPIHLGAGVRVHSFTLLRGPALVGPDTHLLGGTFEALGCGPVCRLRGEISETVLLGWTNKAHDGYLGHALVGRWVNLGAFTTNSDLKNNYGEMRVGGPEGERPTGRIKVGVFLGDHVKTGIGTLLNGGTVVGAGTNLFGGSIPWKWIPPFGWGSPNAFGPHRLEPFLETAARAMARRGVPLTDGARAFLSEAWRSVHGAPDGEASSARARAGDAPGAPR